MGKEKKNRNSLLLLILFLTVFVTRDNLKAQPVNCPQLISNTTITKTDATCNNSDGSALIDITTLGGSPPYQLTLNGQTNTSGVFGSLSAGKYLLRVSDNNLCKDSIYITISSINALSPSNIVASSPALQLPPGFISFFIVRPSILNLQAFPVPSVIIKE